MLYVIDLNCEEVEIVTHDDTYCIHAVIDFGDLDIGELLSTTMEFCDMLEWDHVVH